MVVSAIWLRVGTQQVSTRAREVVVQDIAIARAVLGIIKNAKPMGKW